MNIKKTIQRLMDDTKYIAALEKQNALLQKNLQQEKVNLKNVKAEQLKEKENALNDEEAKYKKRSNNKKFLQQNFVILRRFHGILKELLFL